MTTYTLSGENAARSTWPSAPAGPRPPVPSVRLPHARVLSSDAATTARPVRRELTDGFSTRTPGATSGAGALRANRFSQRGACARLPRAGSATCVVASCAFSHRRHERVIPARAHGAILNPFTAASPAPPLRAGALPLQRRRLVPRLSAPANNSVRWSTARLVGQPSRFRPHPDPRSSRCNRPVPHPCARARRARFDPPARSSST